MIKKGSILCVFFVCILGADDLSIDAETKTIAVRAHKSKLHVIKHYSLPAKGCVHVTAQEVPVYVDTTPKHMVTVAVCIQPGEQFKKTKNALCKGKMIHDDILHITTKEQDIIEAYYISVPESASVMVVSKGDIHATVPYARIEAKGRTVNASFISSTLGKVDETNRCHMQGLISNGKHFEYRPTIELDTQGDITIHVDRNGGLDYGSYLLTQVVGKIKESWQGFQELVTE
jgi:hypothetical protein